MLHLAIAAGLVLGLIVGLGAAATGNEWLMAIAQGSAPFGAIFMNAIRMVVIPLIVTVSSRALPGSATRASSAASVA